MRLLLDTHVAVWSVAYSERLGYSTRRLIAQDAEAVVVSVVSIWEIAIKWPLQGRRDALPFGPREARMAFAEAGYAILPVSAAHAEGVADLDRLHGDPFDRLLVAQALTEPLRLVSADESVLAYGAGFIDARSCDAGSTSDVLRRPPLTCPLPGHKTGERNALRSWRKRR